MMKFLRVLQAEFRKYILEIRNYYPDYIGNLITTYIFFMGFFFIFQRDNGGLSTGADLSKALIGFVIWFFSINVISEASATIAEEKHIGTLEQILLKPAGIIRILLSRSLCWTIVSLVEIIILLVVILTTTNITLSLHWVVIPIIGLTLLGLYGFGFILAGLTILFTKTASFASILQYFFLFFTGTVIKIESLPVALQVISRSLPLTLGIELSQAIISQQITFVELLTDNRFLLLVINAFLYFFIGFAFFCWVYNVAKRRGVIKKY